MRLIIIPAVAMILLVVAMVPHATAQDFTIKHFHADIVINSDASIDVVEKIVVDFSRPRHGIYREIPYKYVTELGEDFIMPITVTGVARADGGTWPYRVTRKGNVVNIRIGHPDEFVRDRQVYVIRYHVHNAIRFLDEYDELYWNVTGTYWRAPIERASATVRMATEKPTSKIIGACYTGLSGSTEAACRVQEEANGATFITDRPMGRREGFTIGMGFDKGLCTPPTDLDVFLWTINLRQNWVFIIPVLVLIYMFIHWYRKGRDPKARESIVVQYEPPEVDGVPLTAAETGCLIDEQLDRRDFTGSVIGLATKGYLELHEVQDETASKESEATDYKLVKLREPDESLTPFERTLMNDLFVADITEIRTSGLTNEFYAKLPRLKKILFETLVAKKFFTAAPDKIKSHYGKIGFLVIIFGSLLAYFLPFIQVGRGIFAALASGLIITFFSGAMVAKSRRGAMAKAHIIGFREFMNRADRDRIKRMGTEIFYKYLPYAIALDVVDTWARLFDGLLTEPPAWFIGTHLGRYHHAHVFSVRSFSRSVSNASSHLGKEMFSAPRGSGAAGGGGFSGGGGGGFSGGGGGGGGGGSW